MENEKASEKRDAAIGCGNRLA